MDTDKLLLVTGGSRGIGAAGLARIFDAVDDVKLPLTGLVNNPGIVGKIAPFTEYTRERLQRTFDVNILRVFECAQKTMNQMLSHGQDRAIVNVSSGAARIGSPNEFIDYAASKGAIDTLTLGLAKEYGPHGIRVNAVRPGVIDTSIHVAASNAGRVARFSGQVPLRRAGEREEVADTIKWLLSEQSTYVMGTFLDVAGGR